MERPDTLAMDQLERMMKELEQAHTMVKDIDEIIDNIPARFADEITDKNRRAEVARYLYWNYPDIPTQAIKDALLGGDHKKMKEIMRAAVDINCDRCCSPVVVSSRGKLTEIKKDMAHDRPKYPEGYTVLCDPCWEEVQRERNAEYKVRESRQQARIAELKQMRYPDYLNTPEWKARRVATLAHAKHRCQVCNSASETLDVHHRTYERRGNEYWGDLIVLCRTCHSTFHGKLVRP